MAEIARFSREEYQNYEDSLKYYRDIKNSLDTAREEGREEGREERKIEIAKNLIKAKIDISIISQTTGLTVEEIKKIQK